MSEFVLDNIYPVSIRCLSDEVKGFTPSRHIVFTQAEVLQKGSVWGLGSHAEQETAEQIARAELIEHYAMLLKGSELLRFGRALPHSVNPAGIRSLFAYQAARADLSIYDTEQEYYWVDGHDVKDGRQVEILADFCIAPFQPGHYPQRVAWANSSGMAAHFDLQLARRSALYELLERDALMVTWMAKAQPPHIPRSWSPESARQTITEMERSGFTVHLLDLTCRGVPVAMAIAEKDAWPALLVCLTARESLVQATEAAVKELEANLVWYLTVGEESPRAGKALRAEEVMDSAEHGLFYTEPQNRAHACFLWASSETSRQDPGKVCAEPELDELYQVDYAAPHSFHVVRLLTPSLVPIAFGYDQLPLTHPARRTVVFPYDVADPYRQDVVLPHPLD